RQDLELYLVDGKQVLDVLDPGNRILDLSVDDVLDGQRVDGALVPGHELEHELRGVRKRRVHHGQGDLRGGEDDEAAIDAVGVEIVLVVQFLGDLGRKAGAIDLEGFQLRRL